MKDKLIINDPDHAIKITPEQAAFIGIKDITADEQRGDMETRGPWNIVKSYKAPAMAANFGEHSKKTKIAFFGPRTLSSPKQSGYQLEGRVSIHGEKYTAFTSTQLFEIDGHLINVSTIFARIEL